MTRKLLYWLALAGTASSIGWASYAQSPSDSNDDAILLLYASDVLRAEGLAKEEPTLLIGALALAAKARGRVFDQDAKPADIGYEIRWDEAFLAVQDNPELLATLATLPGPSRGSVNGFQNNKLVLVDGHKWRGTIEYIAAKPAYLYVQANAGTEIRVTIANSNSVSVCDESRPTGRVMCVWVPRRTGKYTITVSATNAKSAKLPFSITTN